MKKTRLRRVNKDIFDKKELFSDKEVIEAQKQTMREQYAEIVRLQGLIKEMCAHIQKLPHYC